VRDVGSPIYDIVQLSLDMMIDFIVRFWRNLKKLVNLDAYSKKIPV